MKVFETSALTSFDYKNFDEVIVFSELEKENTLKSVIKSLNNLGLKILMNGGAEFIDGVTIIERG